jgi:hypothetical protein
MRRAALVAGILYLVTFIAGIPPAAFMLGPVLGDPNYIVSSGADSLVVLGAFLDLVNALACIGTAVALFSVVRRQHEGFALGFVTTRMVEAVVIVVGVVSLLAVVGLRQEGATGTEGASLVAVGKALVAVRDSTFLLGPGLMPACNALLLGTLMYRSRLVPRIIPTLGLIGAPLLFASTIGTLFGVNDTTSVWTGLATVPIFFWELSLGLYMTFKGFMPDAEAALRAGTQGIHDSATAPAPMTVATKGGAA